MASSSEDSPLPLLLAVGAGFFIWRYYQTGQDPFASLFSSSGGSAAPAISAATTSPSPSIQPEMVPAATQPLTAATAPKMSIAQGATPWGSGLPPAIALSAANENSVMNNPYWHPSGSGPAQPTMAMPDMSMVSISPNSYQMAAPSSLAQQQAGDAAYAQTPQMQRQAAYAQAQAAYAAQCTGTWGNPISPAPAQCAGFQQTMAANQ